MATTSQQIDFNRVQRWGKEFLATGHAGTGGTGRAGADLTPRPAPRAMRAR